jgi:hypothetical protein
MRQIDKKAIRQQFQRHERDTGSSEVQIAVTQTTLNPLRPPRKAGGGTPAGLPPRAPIPADARGLLTDTSSLPTSEPSFLAQQLSGPCPLKGRENE